MNFGSSRMTAKPWVVLYSRTPLDGPHSAGNARFALFKDKPEAREFAASCLASDMHTKLFREHMLNEHLMDTETMNAVRKKKRSFYKE